MKLFENDIIACRKVISNAGVILYPTDTVWGLGCSAYDIKAIQKIATIKKRNFQKSMIILLAEAKDVLKYVAHPPPNMIEIIEHQNQPTTFVYDNAINLPDELFAADGSIAIRVTQDEFCVALIKCIQLPLVSTSANVSNDDTPLYFNSISTKIKSAVDYIVKWKQEDITPSKTSSILKFLPNGDLTQLR